MTDISISLNNIQNVKTVNIEGLGVFRVRKLGAGEELDLSFKHRRLNEIITQLQKIDFLKYDLTDEKQLKEFEKVNQKTQKLSDEITDIKKFELETYKKCFEDDKDGKLVDELMNSLSDEERGELFKQIFKPVELGAETNA